MTPSPGPVGLMSQMVQLRPPVALAREPTGRMASTRVQQGQRGAGPQLLAWLHTKPHEKEPYPRRRAAGSTLLVTAGVFCRR